MPKLIYIFLVLELLSVAIFDVTKKKIYNIWSFINITTFFLILYFYPDYYAFDFETFIFSIVFLAVGLVLYSVKVMGPGDTKFLFSLFPLIPVNLQEDYFYCFCVITVIVGSSLFFTNIIENREKVVYFLKTGDFNPMRSSIGKKFPFAPLIFLSWIWFGWRNYKNLI